jgi:peptidoglycan hydrolase-like protein with peptidoglycan-binding domain
MAISDITRNLEPGMSGSDVTELQNWLISQGYQIPAGATGYYGEQTKNAVAQWQSASGIDTAGYPGYFGPRSKSFINQQITSPTYSPDISSPIPEAYTPPVATDTSSDATAQTYDTGDETLNGILNNFSEIISNLEASGQKINPNIAITPEVAQRFINQASAEVDPYYKSQFESIKGDLQTNLNELAAAYDREKASSEAKFRENLGLQTEKEATAGTVFSGGRTRRLGDLTSATERELAGLSTEAVQKARTLGTTAEQTIGSSALTGLTSPNIGVYSPSTTGRGSYTTSQIRSLYTPTGGVVGSEERAQTLAKRTMEDYLRSKYLEEQGL